ncbi:MAG: hypothetical protein ACRDTH_13595 [Pseudonocardiaceae bacterium]
MRLRHRALITVVEVLAAIVLAWLAWWCWHRGVIVTMRDGVALSRIEGRWWAVASGAATLAGILVLDALRQGVLAVAPRPGRWAIRRRLSPGTARRLPGRQNHLW